MKKNRLHPKKLLLSSHTKHAISSASKMKPHKRQINTTSLGKRSLHALSIVINSASNSNKPHTNSRRNYAINNSEIYLLIANTFRAACSNIMSSIQPVEGPLYSHQHVEASTHDYFVKKSFSIIYSPTLSRTMKYCCNYSCFHNLHKLFK